MCNSKFSKILVGQDKMILCRKEALFNKGDAEIQSIIRAAFPELAERFLPKKLFFGRSLWRAISYKVVCCYKMYSSKFDCQVGPLEESDWGETEFIALSVFEEDGQTSCRTEPVSM
ncbi:hypothetical protein ACFLY0_01895 [Patescibacteria group bacterium]